MRANPLALLVAAIFAMAVGAPAAAHQPNHAQRHEHAPHAVPAGETAPTISLTAVADSMSGYNVRITTTNFRFSPENVGEATGAVEGHAHLYVGGVKRMRVYGPWVHVPGEWLTPGANLLRVTLNDNRHAAWAVGDRPVVAELVLAGSETWSGRSIELHLQEGMAARTVTVTKGEPVRLLVHAEREQEVHLHGYNVAAVASPDHPAVLEITASHGGRFPLVIHGARDLLGRDEVPVAYLEVRAP